MTPDDIREYFVRRVGLVMGHEVPNGECIRRFNIEALSITGGRLNVDVSYSDIDRSGRPVPPAGVSLGKTKVSLRGAQTPVEIFNRILNSIPNALPVQTEVMREGGEGVPEPRLMVLPDVRAQLADLSRGIGLHEGHRRPDIASMERLLKLTVEFPALITPQVFSSKDGRVQGRWFEGKTTLMAIFPLDGSPVLLLASIPRDGDFGRFSVTARTENDRDFPQLAAMLGVRVLRSA